MYIDTHYSALVYSTHAYTHKNNVSIKPRTNTPGAFAANEAIIAETPQRSALDNKNDLPKFIPGYSPRSNLSPTKTTRINIPIYIRQNLIYTYIEITINR